MISYRNEKIVPLTCLYPSIEIVNIHFGRSF